MTVTTRLLTVADAPVMAAVIRENREFLAPWDPIRPEEYYTAEGQAGVIGGMLEQWSAGGALPHAILLDGVLVGRIALTGIVRGPFQSGTLGYWVARSANGRGVASAAVADICRRAFDDLGLHRIEAGTLRHNAGSQRVLQRNGFSRYGEAPRYLNVAGSWQDHILFQRLADD